MISAYYYLSAQQRMKYFLIAGLVCAAGSAVLVPAGIYNFISAYHEVQVSVTSVIVCVVLMSFLFYLFLTKEKIFPAPVVCFQCAHLYQYDHILLGG